MTASARTVLSELKDKLNTVFGPGKNGKNRRRLTLALLFLLPTLLLTLSGYNRIPPTVTVIQTVQSDAQEELFRFTVSAQGEVGGNVYFMITGDESEPERDDPRWELGRDGNFDAELPSGSYTLWTMDSNGNIGSSNDPLFNADTVVGITLDFDRIILALEDKGDLVPTFTSIGSPDELLVWTSSDESVAVVDQDGWVYSVDVGTAIITASTASGVSASAEVVVTDLFHVPTLESYKRVIPPYYYTEEEAHLLDEALAYKVADAGEGTRAGVVAAARFLPLMFEFKIPYFFENGRLNPSSDSRPYCDGEGRYYHKGLYLSVDKYEDITYSVSGPAIWGVNLTNYEDKYYFVRFQRYPNGLDCSGFVSWALYNGGLDVGDYGAGDFVHLDTDMCDHGERVPLTVDLLRSGRVQAGDLIGEDGHIAIVAGIDENYIYIAESLAAGVRISTYTHYRCVTCGVYDFVCLMDSEYSGQGNHFSNVWWEE